MVQLRHMRLTFRRRKLPEVKPVHTRRKLRPHGLIQIGVVLRPHLLIADRNRVEAQAERIMLLDKIGQHRDEQIGAQRLGCVDPHRLIDMVKIGVGQRKKSAVGWGSRELHR